MSSLLNDHYEKIVCVNLVERPDKAKWMTKHFKKLDIKIDDWYHPVILGYSQHFIEPYADKFNNPNNNDIRFNKQFPNEFGTLCSHYTLIKTALLQGVQNLFVFEDDCAFHKDWNELLFRYMNTIPEDADGILLYSYMSKLEQQNVRVTPRWTTGFTSWSFLAYGLNRRAMLGYIKIMDETPMIADRGSWWMMTYQNYNFYIATPPLVIPSKEFTSDIRGENKNYDKPQFLGGNIFMLGLNENNYE